MSGEDRGKFLDVSGEAERPSKKHPPCPTCGLSEKTGTKAAPTERGPLADRAEDSTARIAELEAQLVDYKAQLNDALRGDSDDQKKWLIYWRKRCGKAEQELARYSVSAGLADQFKCEAQAMRVRLGFEKDSEEVAPADLLERLDQRLAPSDQVRKAALDDFTVWLLKTHGLLIDERLLREFGVGDPKPPPDGFPSGPPA